MPGAGCAGSPEPRGAQSVLVALEYTGLLYCTGHIAACPWCGGMHRGPVEEPPELSPHRGQSREVFSMEGTPMMLCWWTRGFRQGRTSGPGQHMWSLCMCFVLERKSNQLGVAWVCAAPAQECGPRGWVTGQLCKKGRLCSKFSRSALFPATFGQGDGKVFAGSVKLCLVDYISISKITLG